jgi:hypothetical protein
MVTPKELVRDVSEDDQMCIDDGHPITAHLPVSGAFDFGIGNGPYRQQGPSMGTQGLVVQNPRKPPLPPWADKTALQPLSPTSATISRCRSWGPGT